MSRPIRDARPVIDAEAVCKWISEQPHLQDRLDVQSVVKFLRGSKQSLERSKETPSIDMIPNSFSYRDRDRGEDGPRNPYHPVHTAPPEKAPPKASSSGYTNKETWSGTAANVPKRQRLADKPTSYDNSANKARSGQARITSAEDTTTIVVVDKSDAEWCLSEETNKMVIDLLNEKLKKKAKSKELTPTFLTQIMNNRIHISCNNDPAVDFIKKSIQEINDAKGYQLEISSEKELPSLVTAKLTTMTDDPKTAMELIQAQNPYLNVDRWKVYKMIDINKNPKGPLSPKKLLICGIDPESASLIEENGNLINLGMVKERVALNEPYW